MTHNSIDKIGAPPGIALTPEHAAYFRDRAISPQFAVACGAHSVVADEAERLLGYALKEPQPGIAFDYPAVIIPFTRVRLDDGTYLTPRGQEIPIFVPFGTDHATERLVVVESPAKAMALAGVGFMAVGLGGVATCLTDTFELNDSWKSLKLNGRDTVLLFDNDVEKPQIARAAARICAALANAGASVRIARLPRGEV
jgi:hypothetical protein